MDVAIEARHITARALNHLRQRSGLEIGDDRVGGDELPEIIAGDVIGGVAVRHDRVAAVASHVLGALAAARHPIFEQHARTEDGRVGTEWGSTCKSRWVPDHSKKKKKHYKH